MIWPRHSLLLILITAGMLLQGGCASRSKDPGPLAYPFFKPAGDNAKELTCVQLDRALRRVDAVRWSMRLDGKKAYTRLEKVGQSIVMAGMSALLFPFDPFNSTLYGVASVANPFVDDQVSAADARIIGLLRIKRETTAPLRGAGMPVKQIWTSSLRWCCWGVNVWTTCAKRVTVSKDVPSGWTGFI